MNANLAYRVREWRRLVSNDMLVEAVAVLEHTDAKACDDIVDELNTRQNIQDVGEGQ
jgi:hypothetical protein